MIYSKRVTLFMKKLVFFTGILVACQISVMEIKDAQGKDVRLTRNQEQVFRSFEPLMAGVPEAGFGQGAFDFSGSARPFMQGMYLNQIARYAQNPDLLLKKPISSDEAELLLAADYLCVNNKRLLYLLANRVWPHIQDHKPSGLQKTAEEKLELRQRAKPFLHSPAYLLEFLRTKQGLDLKKYFVKTFYFQRSNNPHRYILDLSYAACAALAKAYPISVKESIANLEYPFGSLEGIGDLISYVNNGAPDKLEELNLSGHAFREFNLTHFRKSHCWKNYFSQINLADNYIPTLEGDQLEMVTQCDGHICITDLPSYLRIDLSKNPIQKIDDHVYRMVRSWRAKDLKRILILQDNPLTEEQKDEIRYKWYLATHTIPERIYMSKLISGGINVAMLATAIGFFFYIPGDPLIMTPLATCFGGAAFNGAGDYAMFALARISHPDLHYTKIHKITGMEYEYPPVWGSEYRKPEIIL